MTNEDKPREPAVDILDAAYYNKDHITVQTEVDQKNRGAGQLQSVDWSDEPSKPTIVELIPECAGQVEGAITGAFKINRIFFEHPELLKELDRVLAMEEQEHDAIVQAMLEEADKWARAEISRIKGEANNKVRTFISLENSDIQDARSKCKENKKLIKASTKKEMKRIQEMLNASLKDLEEALESSLAATRNRFKDIYKRVEDESKARISQTTASVADFTQTLQGLTLEQLQELKQSGVLQLGDVECLQVPGSGQEDV